MLNTIISSAPGTSIQRGYDGSRLNWLLASNEFEASRRLLFRRACDEEQMVMMRHPVSAARAYAVLGMLLGALPPAAIFSVLFGISEGFLIDEQADGAVLFLCLVMNVACSLGGYAMGSVLSRSALELERGSWPRMLFFVALLGAAWGGITGAIGGFFLFAMGAFVGWAFGIPVGICGFLMFAIIHRALERGGMIEARHLVPLACGIAAIIASLIMGF